MDLHARAPWEDKPALGWGAADWRLRAACRGMPTALFFSEQGRRAAKARAVCAACPVKTECLKEGLECEYGIFGGLLARERRRLFEPEPFALTCALCGRLFKSRRRHTQGCSRSCRGKLYKRKQARRRLRVVPHEERLGRADTACTKTSE